MDIGHWNRPHQLGIRQPYCIITKTAKAGPTNMHIHILRYPQRLLISQLLAEVS